VGRTVFIVADARFVCQLPDVSHVLDLKRFTQRVNDH